MLAITQVYVRYNSEYSSIGKGGFGEFTIYELRCTILDSRQFLQRVCCKAQKSQQFTSLDLSITIYSFIGDTYILVKIILFVNF